MMRAGLPCARLLGLALDQREHSLVQAERRDGELACSCVGFEKPVSKLKSSEASSPKSGPRREEAEVGVDARRRRVVVAGAEVHVAAHGVALAAHDERDLGVRLEADEAVDHVHAGPLERARPLDVVLLVEARLELDEHGDLLAVLGRARERGDDRRVGAGAVERLLDGEHVRVVGRLLEEPQDRDRTSRTGGAAGRRPCGSSRTTLPGGSKIVRAEGRYGDVLQLRQVELQDARSGPRRRAGRPRRRRRRARARARRAAARARSPGSAPRPRAGSRRRSAGAGVLRDAVAAGRRPRPRGSRCPRRA